MKKFFQRLVKGAACAAVLAAGPAFSDGPGVSGGYASTLTSGQIQLAQVDIKPWPSPHFAAPVAKYGAESASDLIQLAQSDVMQAFRDAGAFNSHGLTVIPPGPSYGCNCPDPRRCICFPDYMPPEDPCEYGVCPDWEVQRVRPTAPTCLSCPPGGPIGPDGPRGPINPFDPDGPFGPYIQPGASQLLSINPGAMDAFQFQGGAAFGR